MWIQDVYLRCSSKIIISFIISLGPQLFCSLGPQLFCSADLHAVLFWRYLSSEFCPIVSDQPKTHPFHTHPPHIPYRRKEPIHPTSIPLFHTHSNYTPGLTNCPIKWVTNSPPGKGSSNAAHEVLDMKIKWTLPPVSGQWPMAQSISIETTNIRSLKANDTSECRKKLKLKQEKTET